MLGPGSLLGRRVEDVQIRQADVVSMWPPYNQDPSVGQLLGPAQKRFAGAVIAVKACVVGFQTPLLGAQLLAVPHQNLAGSHQRGVHRNDRHCTRPDHWPPWLTLFEKVTETAVALPTLLASRWRRRHRVHVVGELRGVERDREGPDGVGRADRRSVDEQLHAGDARAGVDASIATLTRPLSGAPDAGLVIVTVGAVVSGRRSAGARNATVCMIQGPALDSDSVAS